MLCFRVLFDKQLNQRVKQGFSLACRHYEQTRRNRDRKEAFPVKIPRCGRSQLLNNEQKPSIVFTWASQKPSPSSSLAYLSRAVVYTLVSVAPFIQPVVDAVLIGVDQRLPATRLFFINGSMVVCRTLASI